MQTSLRITACNGRYYKRQDRATGIYRIQFSENIAKCVPQTNMCLIHAYRYPDYAQRDHPWEYEDCLHQASTMQI